MPPMDAFTASGQQNPLGNTQNIHQPSLQNLTSALTSAEAVLYQWDPSTGLLCFSENISSLFPLHCPIPVCEADWQALIHSDDLANWLQHKALWQSPNASSNLRYRITDGDQTIWVRQGGVSAENGDITGLIYFNCRPDEKHAPMGMQVSRVSVSSQPRQRDYVYPEELVHRLQQAMDRAAADRQQGALLILSIANFGMIINAYGHQASETVIQEIGEEIRKLLAPSDALYRIHRDQFGIVLSDCLQEEIAGHANQISSIIHSYGQNASIGTLHAICAIGSMYFPAAEAQATDIIDKAYIALHKTNGTIHRSFLEGPDEKMMARQQMGLANYLRRCIHENKLRLAFQPIIESHNGNIAHYEALLRLIGEDGKISSAGALIPVAERMGLIDMVDHIVLDMVVKELEDSPQVKLAFNVSNLTTDNPHWLQHFKALLKDKPHIAQRLMVEITETAAHRDLRRTAYFVASVQDLGCLVALDDFGSGYTSFRQLKALSVDMVKIDGAFIKDLVDNADNRFFVKTLLEFTKGYGLRSVAEFVENGETAKMLIELGVDMMQGYYFGKPENFRSWLNNGEYKPS